MVRLVPIIDLFAGPGGLAEGFGSLADSNGNRVFDIRLSIEKDKHAHETLTLRSFLRQFPLNGLPDEYYSFLRGDISLDLLYKSFPNKHKEATLESWQATLGDNDIFEIDQRIKNALNKDKNWVLIGGPPCQAYSLAGRSRVGGIDENDHRVHLYKEYLRIIALHQPAVFVMENVKGLLSAELNNEKIFPKILNDLKDPSSVFSEYSSKKYNIHSLITENIEKDGDYLIRSEEYGVPQKRHRVILLGVREDIESKPGFLVKKDKVYLKSIIDQLPPVRSGIYREFVDSENLVQADGTFKKRRIYRTLKDSFKSWEKLINVYRSDLRELVTNNSNEKPLFPQNIGQEFITYDKETLQNNHPLANWYTDLKVGGILHHVSRAHLTLDLKRYLFSSSYAAKFKKFPRLDDFKAYGEDLVPDHQNVESGKFNDRFRVQLPDEPATTVTSHISKDGHYFIHYDPIQCRSLTVREAARIQTFPDNYFFCGSRTQQFHQVGNAVPPYLAYQISKIVNEVLINHKATSQ